MEHPGADRGGALGRRLRQLRDLSTLTREQLAERSAVSPRTIASLELGTVRRPRASTLGKLCRALDVDSDVRAQLIALTESDIDDVGTPAMPLPRELPSVAADAAGREPIIAAGAAWLTASAHASTAGAPVWSISGPPGVGKTTVAVLTARRVADHFPDGQVFVTLGGGSASPPSTFDVLRRLLLTTGVHPKSLPDTVDQAAALLRSRLSDRRVLLVLDDLPADVDATPLLPASTGCAVVFTSRAVVASLPSARHEALPIPAAKEALGVLRAVVGDDRVAAEPAAAARLVELCDRLPLAVRVAGARLAGRPDRAIASVAGRLADERQRLDEVSGHAYGVRACLATAYESLDPRDREAFRLLGDLDTASGPAWVLAAGLDIGVTEAMRRLSRLAEAQLVGEQSVTSQARYDLHDLTRLYARERAEQDDPEAERSARLARVCQWWQTLATHATRDLPTTPERLTDAMPPPSSQPASEATTIVEDGLEWFGRERSTIIGQVARAVALDDEARVWPTLAALMTYLLIVPIDDEIESLATQLAAVCHAHGDHRGGAVLELMLATSNIGQRTPENTLRTCARARKTFHGLGDRYGELAAMIVIAFETGRVAHYANDPSIARPGMPLARAAVEAARALGDEEREVDALIGLTHLAHSARLLDEAESAVRQASRLLVGRGRRHTQAQVDWLFGTVLATRGDLVEAGRLLQRAFDLTVALGDDWGRARVGVDLAVVLRRLGMGQACTDLLSDSHDLAAAIGHLRLADEARRLARDVHVAVR